MRCHLDIPMVIENHPVLDDGTPFPTLYWLTCPILNKRVGSIEGAGVMNALTERLGDDEDLRSRLTDAIDRYRDARAAHAAVDDAGAPPGGGPDRVKCLHAHVAHELAGGSNPVGALALSMIGWPDCVAPCAEVRR